MSAEHLSGTAAVDVGADLGPNDKVAFETGEYEFDEPLTVADVEVVEWRAADGSSWRTVDLELASSNGGTHRVTAVEGDGPAHDVDRGGQDYLVRTLEPFDEPDDAWCGECGAGPMSVRGVKIHNGRMHDGDADVRYTGPDPDESDKSDSSDTDDAPAPADPDGDLAAAVVPKLERVLKCTGSWNSKAQPYHLPDPVSPEEPLCNLLRENEPRQVRPVDVADRDGCSECVKLAVEHDVDAALALLDEVEEHAAERARDEVVDELPSGLTEADIHQVADLYGTLADCAADMDVSPGRAHRILDAHDRLDDVATPPALDLTEYGSHVTVDVIAEAVGGAASVYEVQNGLRVNRAVAKRVLDDIGFYDEVNGHGGSAPTEDDVRDRLERFVIVGVGRHA